MSARRRGRRLATGHERNVGGGQGAAGGPGWLLGAAGEGWRQVTSELSLERSGPERYLSSFALFIELVRLAQRVDSEALRHAVGRLTAELWTLRQMSLSVAGQLAAGEDPMLAAALVK